MMHMCVCMHVCIFACVFVSVYVSVYVCMCVCMYECILCDVIVCMMRVRICRAPRSRSNSTKETYILQKRPISVLGIPCGGKLEYTPTLPLQHTYWYGVATICRLLQIIGLFCRI